jgi:hypothetical protein
VSARTWCDRAAGDVDGCDCPRCGATDENLHCCDRCAGHFGMHDDSEFNAQWRDPSQREADAQDPGPCLQVERDERGEPAVCTLTSGHAGAHRDGETGHAWDLA